MRLEKLIKFFGVKWRQKDWDSIPHLISDALRTHEENSGLTQISVDTPAPKLRELTYNRAVWDLPIRGEKVATMSIDGTRYLNDENHVVFVSASKFYAVWWALREFDPRGICEVEKMPEDRKYGGQEKIWANSADRPVPLADVSYHEGYGIGFIDGITRTLWLLYNGASSFPVRVHGKKAALSMQAAVGDHRFEPVSVQNLLAQSGPPLGLERVLVSDTT